ncbi:hypothetical protein JAAARDRAFT_639754 [Jaapia argillacea MUCL 33604]|uniref:Uncharacterized protein n=1 Tax=Jaapia argillacea MUCL 33604 TaxID=933084 RepID=A0A067P4A0_9AGAM|nr:hypothetical protein JAAARDRAFT_639754 [Jaapia argillacea MUCL 33604]
MRETRQSILLGNARAAADSKSLREPITFHQNISRAALSALSIDAYRKPLPKSPPSFQTSRFQPTACTAQKGLSPIIAETKYKLYGLYTTRKAAMTKPRNIEQENSSKGRSRLFYEQVTSGNSICAAETGRVGREVRWVQSGAVARAKLRCRRIVAGRIPR